MTFGCTSCVWAGLALAASGPSAAVSQVPAITEEIFVVGTADDDAVEAARRISLERSALAALPAETLAEAISELPGIVVLFDAPFGGIPMVIARGFFGGGEVDYVGLEVDGVARSATESGVADWRGQRLDDVERIDLLSGPSMRRGGFDPALAGTIRVVSRPPPTTPPGAGGPAEPAAGSAEAALSLASFETAAAWARWNGALGGWRAALAADVAQTAGYRDNGAAEEEGFEVRLARATGVGRWDLSGHARFRDREEPGPLSLSELALDPRASNPLFDEDRERSARWSVAGQWEGGSERVPLAARLVADGRDTRFVRTLLVAEGLGDRAVRFVDTGGLGLGLASSREIVLGRRGGVRFALDYRSERADLRYEQLESGATTGADGARRDHLSGEVGLALRAAKRLEFDLSLRGDRVRDRSDVHGAASHSAASPRFGAVWKLRDEAEDGFQVHGEIGRAYRAPTLDQLFDPRPFAGPDGPFTLSNARLEPQRTRGWEVGLEGRKRLSSWRLVAYRMSVENEIDFDPATFRYANIGRSRHEGIESSWRRAVGRAGEVRASYVRSHVEAEGHTPTGQLKNIPRDVARVGWNVRLPGSVELDLRQSFLAGRWADDAHRYRLDDVLRTDLRLARAIGDFRLRLDVLNLFDQDAFELAYVLPNATFDGESLHGFAPVPLAFRMGVERSW